MKIINLFNEDGISLEEFLENYICDYYKEIYENI